MTRYTHMEIEKAKMLARKVSTFRNAQVTPLSRVRAATTLLVAVIRTAIWMRLRALSRWLRDKQVCPRCEGTRCGTCGNTGEATWEQIESLRWGRALFRYRLSVGMEYVASMSNQFQHEVEAHEKGYIPLDDWNDQLRSMADLQLDREAAGHVSTT